MKWYVCNALTFVVEDCIVKTKCEAVLDTIVIMVERFRSTIAAAISRVPEDRVQRDAVSRFGMRPELQRLTAENSKFSLWIIVSESGLNATWYFGFHTGYPLTILQYRFEYWRCFSKSYRDHSLIVRRCRHRKWRHGTSHKELQCSKCQCST